MTNQTYVKVLDTEQKEITGKVLRMTGQNEQGAYLELEDCTYFVKKELCEVVGVRKTSIVESL